MTTITNDDLADIPEWAHPGRDLLIYGGNGSWSPAHVERVTRTQIIVNAPGFQESEQRYRRDKLTRIHPRYGGILQPVDTPAYQESLRVRVVNEAVMDADRVAAEWIRNGGSRGTLDNALEQLGKLEAITAAARARLAELDAHD